MNTPPTGGLGKGMMLGAWVLLLLLLTLVFGRVLERRENPNPDPGGVVTGEAREVRLVRNADGHYVAGGAVNGLPVTFLVDTGATRVAVSKRLADRLGLERRGGTFSRTANGVVAVWQTRLDRVRLGVIEQRAVPAVILPELEPWDQVLLGMSFLKHLEMEQRDGVLVLRQKPRGK